MYLNKLKQKYRVRIFLIALILLFLCKEYSVKEMQKEYIGTFKVTAYCPCKRCCGKSDGITASGKKAKQGRTVAMNDIPFGTKLLINGKIYIVEDRGTSYGHVDIFFNSHKKALKFGVKYIDIYIVSNKSEI